MITKIWNNVWMGIVLCLMIPQLAMADGNNAQTISVFTSPTCGHCQKLEEYLSSIKDQYPDMTVRYYGLEDNANVELFVSFTDKYSLPKVTPITLIGNQLIEGFGTESTTGKQILDILNTSPESDSFEKFMERNQKLNDKMQGETCITGEQCQDTESPKINIPFFGDIDPKDYSMPVLTILLGFVDGFNPCAMWVLVMFITLIVQANERRKMWEMVLIFLLAEAIMYYLILNFWYKTWNFVQMDQYVTPVIGIISIGSGIYFCYEYFINKGECKIIDPKTKQTTRSRLEAIIKSPLTIGTFIATIFLAFSINIIEFACSIGIPQVFTKVLEINNYSFFTRQFYLWLYTLMYMVDDLVVFGVALFSINKLGLTTKYAKYCLIIAAVAMVIIGILMIVSPESLRF